MTDTSWTSSTSITEVENKRLKNRAMKTALTLYTFFCIICPIFNYEKEQPKEEVTIQPEWLCDCGVERHWKDEYLKEF